MGEIIKPDYNLERDAYLGYPLQSIFLPKLARLAEMAKDEPWNFKNPKYIDPNNSYPILYNYLCFTYDRLKEEDKLLISSDGKNMCFNTGLQTVNEQDIFAFFNVNSRYPDKAIQKWFFIRFCLESDRDYVSHFNTTPQIASYFDDASDLIFDYRFMPIIIDYEHIVDDNYQRLKECVGIDTKNILSQLLQAGVQRAEKRVLRNYKLAIPQFYTDKYTGKSKIQLLLPLFIHSVDKADLALVIEKTNSDRHYRYIAKTIFPLDWAYMNSRRLVKPDVDWISFID